MIYYCYHWYRGKEKPCEEARPQFFNRFELVPGNKKKNIPDKYVPIEPVEAWAVEINDIEELQDFVKSHAGCVQVKAPTKTFPHWSIYVSDDGKWGQK